MERTISKTEFLLAEKAMNNLLTIATKKGGFEELSKKESADLNKFTQIVNSFEEKNYSVPMPETVQGLIELKMFEKKLKQKELARLLKTTDTKLSEIMHKKRQPSVSFLKALNQVLGIDGNLLLKIV